MPRREHIWLPDQARFQPHGSPGVSSRMHLVNAPDRGKSGVSGRKPAARGKAKAGGNKRAGASETSARSGRRHQAQRPRAETKGGKILELIGRPQGASLSEIMRVTSWQAHSVRGFLSTAGKKHGLKIGSTKTKTGDRVYQLNK